jgi:ParB family transcriptional regulator, chromosome partitioning protein
MAKDRDLLARFGANLAESMGAGRVPGAGLPGGPPETPAAASRHDGCARLRTAAEIDIDRIVPDPNQPRTDFDPAAIERLAQSMQTHGELQPISVRWSDDMGRYLIVTGERRWRAAQRAGRRAVAAIILDGSPSESQVLEMQLVENCIREDLQPIEQARAFRTLMDRNGWPAARLAEALHLNAATVSRALALLDLPCTVQEAVAAGTLAPSVAYEVAKLADPTTQAEVAARVVAEGLSRADTVDAVRRASGGSGKGKGRGATKRKGRKVTSRTFRVAGSKLTIENRRGLDKAMILAALRAAADQVEAEFGGRPADAA